VRGWVRFRSTTRCAQLGDTGPRRIQKRGGQALALLIFTSLCAPSISFSASDSNGLSISQLDQQIYSLDYAYSRGRSLVDAGAPSAPHSLQISFGKVVGCVERKTLHPRDICRQKAELIPDVANRVWDKLGNGLPRPMSPSELKASGWALAKMDAAISACSNNISEQDFRENSTSCRAIRRAHARYMYYFSILYLVSKNDDESQSLYTKIIDDNLQPYSKNIAMCGRGSPSTTACDRIGDEEIQLYAATLNVRAISSWREEAGKRHLTAYIADWMGVMSSNGGSFPDNFAPVFADSRVLRKIYDINLENLQTTPANEDHNCQEIHSISDKISCNFSKSATAIS
jgi:hypothetical protein